MSGDEGDFDAATDGPDSGFLKPGFRTWRSIKRETRKEGPRGILAAAESSSSMTEIVCDWNRRTDRGPILTDLAIHEGNAGHFAALAATGQTVLLVDGEDTVEARLVLDPVRGWVGVADWSTQAVRPRLAATPNSDAPGMVDAPATRGWYTPAEVAAEFGVEETTVLGWISLDQIIAIPALRQGETMRIPLPALDAYKRRRGLLPPIPRSISPGHRHDLTGKVESDPEILGGTP